MAIDYTNYDALDPEQKALLTAYEHDLRYAMANTEKLLHTFKRLVDWNTTNIQAITTQLTNGSFLRMESGLGGAVPLTDVNIAAMVADMNDALLALNTTGQQALRIKAAGGGNVVGEI